MVFLTSDDVKNICFDYAKAHLAYDEPLPDFETRYVDKLESALHAPQTSIGGKFMFSSMSQQAAVLFYEMIKLHPFLNGNKRMGCVALTTFLAMNDHWLEVTWKELYDVAVTVANSQTAHREGVLSLLGSYIEKGLRKF
jgi:death-on-curing family protein